MKIKCSVMALVMACALSLTACDENTSPVNPHDNLIDDLSAIVKERDATYICEDNCGYNFTSDYSRVGVVFKGDTVYGDMGHYKYSGNDENGNSVYLATDSWSDFMNGKVTKFIISNKGFLTIYNAENEELKSFVISKYDFVSYRKATLNGLEGTIDFAVPYYCALSISLSNGVIDHVLLDSLECPKMGKNWKKGDKVIFDTLTTKKIINQRSKKTLRFF